MLFEKYRFVAMPPAKWAELIVDPEKCNGCGRCVKACPVQLLEVYNKVSRSNYRYDVLRCLTCENCAVVCPEGAIRIERDYRVPKGFWKNENLYQGTKTLPAPFGKNTGTDFESYKDNLTEVERVIYKRRSNRLFKKKQVEPELINRIIESGRFAPSAGNNQPWKFVVIQDPKVLSELNLRSKKTLRFFSRLCLPKTWIDKYTPGDKKAKLKRWQKWLLWVLVWFVGGDADQRAHGGLNAVTSDPDFPVFFNAPTMIILLADKRAIGGTRLDMGLCAQNMVLTAHSLGLGTCYVDLITKALQYDKKFSRRLGIAHPFEVITSLAIGYPQGKIDGIVRREKPRVIWIK